MEGTASQRETATAGPEMVTLTLSFSDVAVILVLGSVVVSESLCESSPSYDTRPTKMAEIYFNWGMGLTYRA